MTLEEHLVEQNETRRTSSIQLIVRERHAPESQLPLPGGAMSLNEQVRRNGPFEGAQAVGWVLRMTRAVEHMHEAGEVHGSIAAQTVMTGGRDPRCWAVLRRHAPSPHAYRSPERLAGGGRSKADDTWALAVTLFFLLTGREPFPGESAHQVRAVILGEGLPPLGLHDAALRRVIESALQQRIAERLLLAWCFRVALDRCANTYGDVPALQRHPWPPPTEGVHLPTSPSSSRPPRVAPEEVAAMLDEAKTIERDAVSPAREPRNAAHDSERSKAAEAFAQLRRADRVRESSRKLHGKAGRRARSGKGQRANLESAPSVSVRAIARAIEQTLSCASQE